MVVVAGLAFVVLALLLVPPDPVLGGTPSPVQASWLFFSEEFERAET